MNNLEDIQDILIKNINIINQIALKENCSNYDKEILDKLKLYKKNTENLVNKINSLLLKKINNEENKKLKLNIQTSIKYLELFLNNNKKFLNKIIFEEIKKMNNNLYNFLNEVFDISIKISQNNNNEEFTIQNLKENYFLFKEIYFLNKFKLYSIVISLMLFLFLIPFGIGLSFVILILSSTSVSVIYFYISNIIKEKKEELNIYDREFSNIYLLFKKLKSLNKTCSKVKNEKSRN